MERVTVVCPPELSEQLHELARERNISTSNVVRYLVQQALEQGIEVPEHLPGHRRRKDAR